MFPLLSVFSVSSTFAACQRKWVVRAVTVVSASSSFSLKMMQRWRHQLRSLIPFERANKSAYSLQRGWWFQNTRVVLKLKTMIYECSTCLRATASFVVYCCGAYMLWIMSVRALVCSGRLRRCVTARIYTDDAWYWSGRQRTMTSTRYVRKRLATLKMVCCCSISRIHYN